MENTSHKNTQAIDPKFLPFMGKIALVGLTYHDHTGQMLKQNQVAGKVIKASEEDGITIELFAPPEPPSEPSETQSTTKEEPKAPAHFILPPNLECWFHAPEGNYRDPNSGMQIKDPDFLITWDIYQKKDGIEDGEQQWWEWVPRTVNPSVGS